MADYIYLLQTRLTKAQQAALAIVREIAKSHGITVFLVGGAVRDLTSGAPIRDLDLVVQGSALSLRKEMESSGGVIVGENKAMDTLYLNFPGGVRLEVGSTISVSFPKPGKPVVEHATILDDLRRRDFTANAMAISLNEGSYGLLMDPLNGVADIENMELRLVSNYGFIEDPVRMVRAVRLSARLGWRLEERTQQRYDNGKAEGYISAMTPAQAGYETEEIFHEEDPLRVLRRLESEGWNKNLFPAWSSAKVNENELNKVRDLVAQLEAVGIHPDPSPAYYPILTAKLAPKDAADLAKSFVRPGFIAQVNALDGATKAFAAQFTSKAATAPSDAWKLLMSAPPELVLWMAYSSKSAPVQARIKAFFTEWPQSRQRIPYQLMQEMRITPELPGYQELVEDLFFAIMDSKLDTPEAARAYLEPHSPPAPPPPPNLRRRAVKRESKSPKRKKAQEAVSLEDGDDLPITVVAASATVSAEPEAKPAPPVATPVMAPPVKKAAKAAPDAKNKPTPAPKPEIKTPTAKPVTPKPATPKPVAAKAVPPVKQSPAKKTAPAKAAAPAKASPKKSASKAPGKVARAVGKTAPKKAPAPVPATKKAASPARSAASKAPAKSKTAARPVKAAAKAVAKKAVKKAPAKGKAKR